MKHAHPLRTLGFNVLFVLLFRFAAHADVTVTDCGGFVPAGERGVLQNDLNGCESAGVVLGRGAMVELNGHTIHAGAWGIYCTERKCTIRGPGQITGTSTAAIGTDNGKCKATVSDVDLHDNLGNGIQLTPSSLLIVHNTDIRHNGKNGIEVPVGIVKGSDVTIRDNTGNGMVNTARFVFSGLALQDNGAPGIVSPFGAGVLKRSLLARNNAHDPSGTMDIATNKRPRLVDSACERSGIIPESGIVPGGMGPGWGVCSRD
jgi:hypothetical protein